MSPMKLKSDRIRSGREIRHLDFCFQIEHIAYQSTKKFLRENSGTRGGRRDGSTKGREEGKREGRREDFTLFTLAMNPQIH